MLSNLDTYNMYSTPLGTYVKPENYYLVVRQDLDTKFLTNLEDLHCIKDKISPNIFKTLCSFFAYAGKGVTLISHDRSLKLLDILRENPKDSHFDFLESIPPLEYLDGWKTPITFTLSESNKE